MSAFDIQRSGTTNRLNNPIAIVGGREEYKQLCKICGLNPHNNDVFAHVTSVQDTKHATYSRVIEVNGFEMYHDRLQIVSYAHAAVRN